MKQRRRTAILAEYTLGFELDPLVHCRLLFGFFLRVPECNPFSVACELARLAIMFDGRVLS